MASAVEMTLLNVNNVRMYQIPPRTSNKVGPSFISTPFSSFNSIMIVLSHSSVLRWQQSTDCVCEWWVCGVRVCVCAVCVWCTCMRVVCVCACAHCEGWAMQWTAGTPR
jgi:hypothetical protein